MTTSLKNLTDYFMELDALKSINRKSYTNDGQRLENSAEHSWHLAMACWNIAEAFELNLNQEKLLKLALVHDLGEIDAGDTFLYADTRNDAHNEEREGVKRLNNHPGNCIPDLLETWDEQEYGTSPETKLLKAIDRLLPFLLNIHTQGKTWNELGVKKHQVENAHAFIRNDFPELHQWMAEQIQQAVETGWLKV